MQTEEQKPLLIECKDFEFNSLAMALRRGFRFSFWVVCCDGDLGGGMVRLKVVGDLDLNQRELMKAFAAGWLAAKRGY